MTRYRIREGSIAEGLIFTALLVMPFLLSIMTAAVILRVLT